MNILVIDDEPLIHLSIEKLILSYRNDIQVFHAYNGHQMLELLTEHRFQLAYVDIKMPGLTGLDAILFAKEVSPDTRYYIMTGFNEFEYAKQAVKLKVEDYLMKPLDLHTIQATIQAAEQMELSGLRERKAVFRNWLENIINHRQGTLGKYEGYYGFVILITIDNVSLPPESFLEKLKPYEDSFVSSFSDNQIILLYFSKDPEYLRSILKNLSSQVYTDGVSFFTSSVTCSRERLKSDLQSLLQHSCLRVLKGSEQFYYLKPLLDCEPQLLQFSSLCVRWQAACFQKDYNEFINYSALVCSRLAQLEELKSYWENILSFFTITMGVPPSLPACAEDLKQYFQEYAKQFLQSSENSRPVRTIIQYIQEHYCENLSIASLAERFGFSANYISNLLKQELGISYSKYITQLRLNRAKELLLCTGQSVKDITATCGYYSQSHFTKLFMEYEGCTPTEYRRHNTRQ